jgi:hypothetical protein
MNKKHPNENGEHRKHLADLFAGITGRQPKNEEELTTWLASADGKRATTFELAPAERWGAKGRA